MYLPVIYGQGSCCADCAADGYTVFFGQNNGEKGIYFLRVLKNFISVRKYSKYDSSKLALLHTIHIASCLLKVLQVALLQEFEIFSSPFGLQSSNHFFPKSMVYESTRDIVLV
jgi:hypothetical protein